MQQESDVLRNVYLVLQGRDVVHNDARVEQDLVKWIGLGEDEPKWLDVEDVPTQFPDLSLVSRRVVIDRPDLKAYKRVLANQSG